MIGVASFVVLGSLVLVVLFILFRRGMVPARSISNVPDARDTVNTLQSELLPDWFVERLFSKEDQIFAHGADSLDISRLFDSERRTVALSWLKQTQEYVAQLMDFHARLARQRPDLRPTAEFKLTLEYVQFYLVCKILAGTIRLVGPIRVRSLAVRAVEMATQLGSISEKLLTELDAAVAENAEERLHGS